MDIPNEKAHRFGGDWTSAKLKVLAAYLESYTTALKDKPSASRPFVKGYIDAFAGTGYRETRPGKCLDLSLFPDLADTEPQGLLDGSARLALKTEPRFDKYVFIEQDSSRCAALRGLKDEFQDLAPDMVIQQGEANQEIREICRKNWSGRRAVLFLDPYGMQVE